MNINNRSKITIIMVIALLITNAPTCIKADTNNKLELPEYSEVAVDTEPRQTLQEQFNELYRLTSENTGLSVKQIKLLHNLAGGNAIYSSVSANVFNEETVKEFQAPLTISGSNIVYKKAEYVSCNSIERPSAYYLPDALYTVASDIKEFKSARRIINMNNNNSKYYALDGYVQDSIDFYEAVLLYTGEQAENVNNFYTAYESILNSKEIGENVCEYNDKGEARIKDKFRVILKDLGISSDNSLNILAKLFMYDENIAMNDSIERLEEIYTVPYTIGETSRENLLLAATSLVGKVRYIWGGGHSGASYIKGINPVWKQFNNLYPSENYTTLDDGTIVGNEGFKTCIKPSGSWCPIHGRQSGEFHGSTIHSMDEYIDLRSNLFNSIDLTDSKYREMLSTVNYDNGINEHVIDGLDCSGFTSWEFNQITDKYRFNTSAKYFTNQNGLSEISMNEILLPCDIFAWYNHIVTIVGCVDNNSTYVTIEETPNVLRFGVAYYSSATSSSIAKAKEIASQANELIGGLNRDDEPPHMYCINNIGNIPIDITPYIKVEETEEEEEEEEISEDNTEVIIVDRIDIVDPNAEEHQNMVVNGTDPNAPPPEPQAGPDPNAEEHQNMVVNGTDPNAPPPEPQAPPVQNEGVNEISNTNNGQVSNNAVQGNVSNNQVAATVSDNTSLSINAIDLNALTGYIYDSDIVIENSNIVLHVTALTPEDMPWWVGYRLFEENGIIYADTMSIARFNGGYEDENTIISEYNKLIKDMNAQEIIQYTYEKLPLSYATGYDSYSGDIFEKEKVATNLVRDRKDNE